jgi:hypothetical protein
MPGKMTTRTRLWGQVSCGQERWSRTARTGQARQDRRTGQEASTDRTVQIGQGKRDRTSVEGQPGYGSRDKTTETGQPGQVNLDWTVWIGDPGQNREDNQDMTATLRQQCQESRGKDCWGRIAGTEQLG